MSFIAWCLKEDKLSVLRVNECETSMELSILHSQAEQYLHKNVLLRVILDKLFTLEKKIRATSYKVQSEYVHEDHQPESAEVETSRIAT